MPSLLTRAYGAFYMAYHRLGQARYPYRPLAQIQADRDRRVRRMVAYAYRTVPYYRETMQRLGLRPDDFCSADDLAKLPILERSVFQRDPQYLLSNTQPVSRCLSIRNSGTTGRPCTFFYDPLTLFQDAAHGERARAAFAPLIGRALGYRFTIIAPPEGGAISMTRRFIGQRSFLPRGLDLQRQYLSLLDPPEVNVPLINAFRPDVIHSYGSCLAELFAYLKASGAPFHHPKALRYTSDALPAAIRRVIEDEFGIPVFGRYEAVETSNLGFECEQHRGMHINIDLCATRIVDDAGCTLPPGESGELIVSNLINRATVFLNYRLGDLATWLPEPCPCGRALPLLSPPEGRRDDWLTLPSGRRVHPQVLPTLFKYHQGIWQFQIVQETPARLCVNLVTDPAIDRVAVSERIHADLLAALGEQATIAVQFVDAIPRTPGGKVRPVVSLAQRG